MSLKAGNAPAFLPPLHPFDLLPEVTELPGTEETWKMWDLAVRLDDFLTTWEKE